MDNTTYKIIEPDVTTAAMAVSRQWPGVLDKGDLQQDLWLVLLESSPESISMVAGMPRAQRVAVLKTFGHRIAAKERDDYDMFAGNYYYGTQDVRHTLEQGGLHGWSPRMSETFDPDKIKDPSDRDREGALGVADLDVGMSRLEKHNAPYAHLIREVYAHGHVPVDSAERKQLTRAVDRLTLEMNRHHSRGGQA